MNKPKKTINLIIATAFIILVKVNVLAGNIQNDKVVTGTKKLIQDATKAIGIIGALVSVLFGIYFFIRKNMADEQDQKMWNKRITTTVICAVGIVVISGLLNTIVKYYQ